MSTATELSKSPKTPLSPDKNLESLQESLSPLITENVRLTEKLEGKGKALQASQSAQIGGDRENYARLEESQNTLVRDIFSLLSNADKSAYTYTITHYTEHSPMRAQYPTESNVQVGSSEGTVTVRVHRATWTA